MEAINLPLYQRIARQLKSAIERGELTPGSRLPASRVYAQEQGVSRATIENAWGELVAQGWLERRGQAGALVRERLRPRQPGPGPPVDPAAPPGAPAFLRGGPGRGGGVTLARAPGGNFSQDDPPVFGQRAVENSGVLKMVG
ncbi:GntR family transcriptional regulator, partial [Klebsiella pneumoniae]|nr:GntR family transcriptional regulator [Klebsiella pneumoniae]